MSIKALEFQQVKEAWLLRKFSPNWVTGYLTIYKYSADNVVTMIRILREDLER